MVFSPPPDYLFQSIHPVTGVVTTWTQMIETDLSFGRASASYAIFSGNGGINPFGKGAAALKIRTFKFTYIHPYQPGETFTILRDAMVKACMHGREMQFFVKCGDGSLRMGVGNCNVSDMRETRDAMVMFQATIEFECVNPFLVDQYETGVLRWDTGLTWDVGHAVFSLAASATLTGGTYSISYGGNTASGIPHNAYSTDVNARLKAATPAPIPFIATGGSPRGGLAPFVNTPPDPIRLSAISPGVVATPTIGQSVTGGVLALTTVQVGSAATPQVWDFSPHRYALTTGIVNVTITAGGNTSDYAPMIVVEGPVTPYAFYNMSLPGGLYGFMGFGMLEGLAAGERHEIDTGRWRVRKTAGGSSASAWAKLYWPPGQEEIFRLDPGPNNLSFQQTPPAATTGFLRVITKNTYL